MLSEIENHVWLVINYIFLTRKFLRVLGKWTRILEAFHKIHSQIASSRVYNSSPEPTSKTVSILNGLRTFTFWVTWHLQTMYNILKFGKTWWNDVKNQFTGTTTQPQRNGTLCQFNNDQYCIFWYIKHLPWMCCPENQIWGHCSHELFHRCYLYWNRIELGRC